MLITNHTFVYSCIAIALCTLTILNCNLPFLYPINILSSEYFVPINLILKFLLYLYMQCFKHLRDLIIKVAEFGLLDWMGRVKLIACICDFVLLNPQIGQVIAGT